MGSRLSEAMDKFILPLIVYGFGLMILWVILKSATLSATVLISAAVWIVGLRVIRRWNTPWMNRSKTGRTISVESQMSALGLGLGVWFLGWVPGIFYHRVEGLLSSVGRRNSFFFHSLWFHPPWAYLDPLECSGFWFAQVAAIIALGVLHVREQEQQDQRELAEQARLKNIAESLPGTGRGH